MKEIYKALANFQYEVPILHKDTKGFSYTYTDLPEIIRVITPHLKNNNLGFTQLIEGNTLRTIIFHFESGETIESVADIPDETMKGMNKFQTLGSAITYLRRYMLSSALGLVTDKDLDATSLEDKLSRAISEQDLATIFKSLNTEEQKKYQSLFTKRKEELNGSK